MNRESSQRCGGRPEFEALEPRLLLSGASAVPDMPDLLDAFDTGVSQSDDITRLDNSDPSNSLTFSVSGAVAGATVTVYAGGTAIGSVVASDVIALVATDGTYDLTDGAHSITARQIEPDKTESDASTALSVTIDTVAPPVPWGLDPNFDGDGKLTTDFGADEWANDLAIQADGKIVVAGGSGGGGFSLTRYDPGGSLDTTFDGDGRVTTVMGVQDQARAMAIQADGKIVVAGSIARSWYHPQDIGLARYNVDGSLDTTFSGDGKVVTVILNGLSHSANAVAIQSDGKIIVAGSAAGDLALVRYNANGALDTSFDGDGILTTDFVGESGAYAMAIQSDGKIVVAGWASNGSNNDFALVRYNADGSLDTSFDGDGKVTTGIGTGDDGVSALAIQSDGKIVVAGHADTDASAFDSDNDFALARYNTDGSLDTSFDGDGKLTTAFGRDDDRARGLAIQSDGKIVVAGYSSHYPHASDVALARYNADGSLDTDFHGDGKLTMAIATSYNYAYAVAIQPDGKIVVAGKGRNDNYDTAVARYGHFGIDLQATSDTGLSDIDNITGDSTPTFDVFGASPYFRVYRNGALISGAFESGSTYTCDLQPDGTWDYTATSVDAAGNESGMNQALVVTIDTSAPPAPSTPDLQAASDLGISDTDNLTADNTPTFDVTGGVPYFRIYRDGTLASGEFEIGSSVMLPAQPNGTWDYTATAVGEAGNESAPSAPLAVTIDTQMIPAPDPLDLQAASDSGGSDTDKNTNDNTPTFDVSVTAPYFRVYRDGALISASFESGPSYTAPAQPDGTWNYTVIAVDQAGNESPASGALNVTIDTVDPTAAVDLEPASDTGASANDNITADNTPTLALIGASEFQLYRDSLPLTPDFLVGSSYTDEMLADGDYSYTAMIRDTAGNTSPMSPVLSVTIDTGPPAAPSAPDLQAASDSGVSDSDDITNDNTPMFDVFVVAPYFRVHRYGRLISGLETGSTYTAPFQDDGMQSYTVTAVDEAGNESAASAALSVTIDTEAPTVQSWSLDESFGGDGKVITTFGTGDGYARAMAIQSDGKIVAAGYAYFDGNADFTLARYNIDGSLDASFDGDGIVTTAFGAGDDKGWAVAILPDGKIVVAGSAEIGGNADFAVARYNADGSLDATFDGDGKLTTDYWGYDDGGAALAIQSDGKIVVAGSASTVDSRDFAAARYNADGSLDTSFDGDGMLTTDFLGTDEAARAVAIQSDGKIVVAGQSASSGSNFALARYNADGSLDSSFDGDGKLTTEIETGTCYVSAVVIQPDGKIIAAGSAGGGYNMDTDFGLARYNTDGSLDVSFDGDGTVTTSFGDLDRNDVVNAMAIQGDGRIVVAGWTTDGGHFALARYNADGSLDASFDGDGKLTTGIGGRSSRIQGIDIQSNGKIVAAGYTYEGFSADFALARYGSTWIDLQAASDTGVSDTDNITGDDTPTFDVSVTTPYFRFHRDTSLISGRYESGSSYTTAIQPEGTFAYSVRAVDTAGNDSWLAAPLNVTFLYGEIRGTTWNDLDSDGIQDAGEFGINGWTVDLVDTDTSLTVATTTTAGVDDNGDEVIDPQTEAGRYAFAALPAGNYETRVTSPSGWTQTSPMGDPIGRLFAVRGAGTSMTVYEIDPADGSVLNSFAAPPTGLAGLQGLAVGPDSLFYLDAGNPTVQPVLWELDLDTGAVIDSDSVPATIPAMAMGVAWLDGEVYIQLQPDEIAVFDPSVDTVVRTLSIAGNVAGGLAASGELGVLFACNSASQILTIDPATGAILDTFTLGVGSLFGGLAYCNGELLASNMLLDVAGTVHRVDPVTGDVLGTLSLDGEGGTMGGLGGDYVAPPAPIWHQIALAAGELVAGVDYAYHTSNAPGDMDGDGDVDADDIDLLFADFGDAGHAGPQSDLDGDGDADSNDMDILIHDLVETTVGVGTEYGDTNLDGMVDTTDLTILATHFAHSGVGWAGGDLNGSGLVNITDLVILATHYGFSAPPPGGGDSLSASAAATLGPAPATQLPQAQAANSAPATSEAAAQTPAPVTQPLSAASTSSAAEPAYVSSPVQALTAPATGDDALVAVQSTPLASDTPSAGPVSEPDGQLPSWGNPQRQRAKRGRGLGHPNQPAPTVMALAPSDAPTTRRRGRAERAQGQVPAGAAAPARQSARHRSQNELFEDEFSALDVDPLMKVTV